MAKLTNVQRAFLAGIRHGRRAAKQARRDLEDLLDEHEADAEVRADLARRQAIDGDTADED